MEAQQVGIVIYRASRLESLLEPLELLLSNSPPASLLAPQTVLAAHPGIKRWLTTALARQRGPAGIVANLDVQLPSSWLQSFARERLGVDADALLPYRRESLRWRIFEQLPLIDDADIQRYLSGDDASRRRFQLADRIAGIYARYQVYRPDWLADWQSGRTPRGVPASFLGPLWRQLRQDIAQPQRGELLATLQARLYQSEPVMQHEPLHVFGVSHLPPSELSVLRAVARERLVALYLPDPCLQHWAGLSNEASELRRMLKQGVSEQGELDLLALGHPLLAAWGRMGQHFGVVLNEGEQGVLAEVRHYEDYAETPESYSRLHRLQDSLRQMEPSRMQGDDAIDDASLRIHGCHTRLRELEVLRDELLKAMSDKPELQPAQIVVMAPDISAYAPLIPSVFGAPGDAGAVLPYHLADVGLASAHPVFAAFTTLLGVPMARLGVSEVRDLLAVPAISRSLALDDSGLEMLSHWLANARVAWGLDASSRSRFGLPSFDEHSLAWGVDRLIAGYVMGEPNESVAETLHCWPVAGVHGVQVAALGALDRLLGEIDSLCRDAAIARPLSHWVARLHALVELLFSAAPSDVAESEAIETLRKVIDSVDDERQPAGCDPVLDYTVIRELLMERLQAVPERQPFLLGGVTFCGMVPQRSIPFEVVAVLGLNDGEFPRAGGEGGIDLMTQVPRLGDRDVRSDDRYLFLETVMATRWRLHLSYLAEGVRDGKTRNPAAPLAELITFLQAHTMPLAAENNDASPDYSWQIRHALQPFDQRYFSGKDPRWFSFNRDFSVQLDLAASNDTPFLPATGNDSPAPSDPLPLASVLSYFRDPARQVLQERVKLRLDALSDDALSDDEALAAKADPGDRLPQQLLREALQRSEFVLSYAPPPALRLGGVLPAGRAGLRAYAVLRKQVEPLLALAKDDALLCHGLPAREALLVDRQIGGFRVQGALPRVHPIDSGWLLFEAFPTRTEEAAIGFRERLPVLIEWALLRLHALEQGGHTELRLLYAGKKQDWQASLRACAWTATQWQHRLEQVLAFYWHAQSQPVPYFPKTSWALATAKPGREIFEVRQAWFGGEGGQGERDYSPGHARVLARGRDHLNESHPDWAAWQHCAFELTQLLALDAHEGAAR